MTGDTYIVICQDEGEYVLATRQIFPTCGKALGYAKTIAPTRFAMVVPGRWTQLRAPADHMFIPKIFTAERHDERCWKCDTREETHEY